MTPAFCSSSTKFCIRDLPTASSKTTVQQLLKSHGKHMPDSKQAQLAIVTKSAPTSACCVTTNCRNFTSADAPVRRDGPKHNKRCHSLYTTKSTLPPPQTTYSHANQTKPQLTMKLIPSAYHRPFSPSTAAPARFAPAPPSPSRLHCFVSPAPQPSPESVPPVQAQVQPPPPNHSTFPSSHQHPTTAPKQATLYRSWTTSTAYSQKTSVSSASKPRSRSPATAPRQRQQPRLPHERRGLRGAGRPAAAVPRRDGRRRSTPRASCC